MNRCRWVDIAGVANFRDLGGYPAAAGASTRWGTVFRSGMLDGMSERGGHSLAQDLGVRTVIDLRRADEVPADLTARLRDLGVAHHNIPLGPGGGSRRAPRDMTAFLLSRSDDALPGIAAAFGVLRRRTALPAVLACRLGRDRTGLAVLFLLSLLAVPDRDIAADFALSPQQDDDAPNARHTLATDLVSGLRARHGDLIEALSRHGAHASVAQDLCRILLERSD